MLERLLEILACSHCYNDKLKLEKEKVYYEEIIKGMLVCPNCRRRYPIVEGIPCLLPDELRRIGTQDKKLWLEKRRTLSKKILDMNGKTYKEKFIELAQKEARDAVEDGFLWEEILYEETLSKSKKIGAKGRSRWTISEEVLTKKNTIIMDLIRQVEGTLQDKLVLNIGPGVDCDMIARLEAENARIISLDFVMEAVRQLKKKKKRDVICADARRLPFNMGIFDLVLCIHVLHHLHPIEETLSGMIRVLNWRGKADIIELNNCHPCTWPTKILPKVVKINLRKYIRRYVANSEDRLFKPSPYEVLMSSRQICGAMANVGFKFINKNVVRYATSVLPDPIVVF